MHDPLGPETRSDPPQAAACEFRSVLGSGGGIQGQTGGDDPSIIEQLRGLEAWAAARGELPCGEWLTTAERGGAEHFIQHAPHEARVIKITYPAQFGLRMRFALRAGTIPKHLGEAIGLMPATPLEYLDRLALHNAIFGDDMLFLGLVRQAKGWSLVTSQVFLRGEKPSIVQIEAFMRENGFRKLGDENAYFRQHDSLAIFDAHARNFVLVDGIPVPFDVLPQHVSGRMTALLALF
jgi:Serine/Threonine/Tyrosine Kinase found in polyvalent proteins